MQVASRYASCFALCESACLWKGLLPMEEWSSTVRVRSLRPGSSIDGCEINACCGNCRFVVEGLKTFGIAGSTYKNAGGDRESKSYDK